MAAEPRDFSKRLLGEAYGAYGFKDQKFKFKVGFHYHFNKDKNPLRLIGFMYRQDMDQLAVSEKSLEHDNTLNSLFIKSGSSFQSSVRKNTYGIL